MERARIIRAYHATFATESGQIVLAELLRTFPPDRPRFSQATNFDLVRAAVLDGQAQTVKHILNALKSPIMDDPEAAEKPDQPKAAVGLTTDTETR